ncbi:hypothetical protein [Pandoraea apista]|uniref:hypothetical protein n=1 Tax=Pandoraea apista TaxID=93218 RepID=UPI00058A92D1|nr:hypothetical protein [Pandoraea apista]AJE99137.1 hypothetical protein SG18_14795 [Pandoraea apista]AKH73235.1 hypothetical protein XM39_14990 [Pandoraea apista]AKI61631.1 hypothetical protein AA956_07330 [Pandoraea apista]
MSDHGEVKAADAEVGRDPAPAAEPCFEVPLDQVDAQQTTPTPAFTMLATAYNLHGEKPCHVVEFEHAIGGRVRRLLPAHTLTSCKSTCAALIKAGVPKPIASSASVQASVMAGTLSATGLYNMPPGWTLSPHLGVVYRYADTAYTSAGPIAVYANGPVAKPPQARQADSVDALENVPTSELSPGNVILAAAQLTSLLVRLLDQPPLVIVVSGMSLAEAESIRRLAGFSIGTCPVEPPSRFNEPVSALVKRMSAKSYDEAMVQAHAALDFGAAGKRTRMIAAPPSVPVTVIITPKKGIPDNFKSQTLPLGCIEIPVDALSRTSSSDSKTETLKGPPNQTAIATSAYIEAVLRNQSEIVEQAATKLLKFQQRYSQMMTDVRSQDAVLAATRQLALLRFGLTLGRRFNLISWGAKELHCVMDECAKQCASALHQRETAFWRCVANAVKELISTANRVTEASSRPQDVILKITKGRELLLIPSKTFDACVVGTSDKKRVLDTLRERDLLVVTGKGSQYQARAGVESPRNRFYAIDVAALRKLGIDEADEHASARASTS